MKRWVAVFALMVLVAAFWALKYSRHPVVWVMGITVSIPLFAAVAGGLAKSDGGGDH